MFAAAGAAKPSNASPVFYDFTIDIVSGPLIGQTLNGSFSFDESVLTGPTLLFNLFEPLGILETFELSFGGHSFDTSNAAMTFLILSGGEIERFLLAGAPSSYRQIRADDGLADFSITSDNVCNTSLSLCPFTYDLPDSTLFKGTFDFARRVVAMPEPWTLGMFALGLAGLGLARRRHA